MRTAYVVKSGAGYLVGFTKQVIPIMTSEPSLAIRFIKDGSLNVIRKMEELGLEAKEVAIQVEEE